MKQICVKCSIETMCPQCNSGHFHQPIIIKNIDKEMPVIISTCAICCVELFRSITYENSTMHKSFCIVCVDRLEIDAWKYRELSK